MYADKLKIVNNGKMYKIVAKDDYGFYETVGVFDTYAEAAADIKTCYEAENAERSAQW